MTKFVTIIAFVIAISLSLGTLISESHCQVPGVSSRSFAEVFRFFQLENALDFVDRFVTCLQQAGGGCVEVVVQGVKCNHNRYRIPKVSAWGHRRAEPFVEVLHLSEYLHYRLFVSFRLGDSRIMEEFLEDQIHYSLADFGADALEFIPHLFGVFQIHNIEGDLVTYALSDDALCRTYCHTVLFDFFGP